MSYDILSLPSYTLHDTQHKMHNAYYMLHITYILHTHKCRRKHTHTYTHAIYMHTQVRMNTCMHVKICTYIYACIHIYIYTDIYAHIEEALLARMQAKSHFSASLAINKRAPGHHTHSIMSAIFSSVTSGLHRQLEGQHLPQQHQAKLTPWLLSKNVV